MRQVNGHLTSYFVASAAILGVYRAARDVNQMGMQRLPWAPFAAITDL